MTVVVPVYDVAQYLPECLDSLLGQTLTDLEVIAVDDGSTDHSLAILERYAAQDDRMRVLTQANAGQGAARNRGAAEARGEFLTFCDSDDVVPRGSYKAMVRTLRRTGSDFVVGAAQRTRYGAARQVAWGRTVHEFDRLATTIDDFPAAMQDIIACNRLFRTAFWHDRIGGFGARTAYEDHVPMLAAYLRADRFDVLARITYQWRMREDLSSTGQQKALLQNLLDRITVKEEAYDLLRAEASEATYDAWVGRCLDVDFPPFLPHALTGSDAYRDALARTYRTFLDRATDRALRTVRHDRGVRAWLCAERRWDDLALADEHFRTAGPPAVRVDGDRLVAVPDLPAALSAPVPERLWALADSETAPRTGLRSFSVEGTTARVSGRALIPGLGTREAPPDLDVWLLETATGAAVPLHVQAYADAEVDQWADDGNASYLHSAFDATVDLAALQAAGAGTTWTLRLRIRQGAVVRESGIYEAVAGASAQRLQPEVVELGGRATLVDPGWDRASGFRLRLGPVGDREQATGPERAMHVHRLDLGPGAILVEATPTGLSESELAAAIWRGQHVDLPATTVEMAPGTARLRFATMVTPPHGVTMLAPSGRYTLVVPAVAGDEIEATAAADLARTLPRSSVDGDLRSTRRLRANGALVIALDGPLDDDERRPDVQQRRRRAHQLRTTGPSAHPGVLLHVGDGTVTDSPAALDTALARLRPDVARSWTVRDASIAVPDGAAGVLRGSRRWFDALSDAPVVCASGDLPDFFLRGPRQRTVQTFAGFPAGPVGRSAWEARGLTARAVALELARRQQQWECLVAPTDEVAELYRAEFEFEGPVLVTGYPRCDDLVGRDRDTVRAGLLARMGMPADHTVVLYAPAHRDRATRALVGSADLDVRRLAAALGPGHLVLTLGVRAPDRPDPSAAPVVDVTTGPAVDDVLHASDVAVLDYSALRFDWALTGRAAVFHVPDRDDYLTAVRPPIDFDETAPGPKVTDVDGVVEAVREHASVAERYAAEVAAFNARWHLHHDGRAAERVVAALLRD